MSKRSELQRPRRGAFALVTLLAFWGCAVGPDFVPPKPPEASGYTADRLPQATTVADGRVQHFELGGAVPKDWWQLFNCPELGPLIEQAVAANPSLQAAQASLRQSENLLRAGYAVFLPHVDAGASAARERNFSPSTNLPATTFNLFTVTGTVGYVLDVFGGERRQVESLGAQADLQRYEAAATYLTLVGNLVNATIAEAGYTAQIETTSRLIATERDQVQITETQARAGTVPYVNVLTLQTQLAAVEAQLPQLQQKRTQTRHLLATLLGQEPAAWQSDHIQLAAIEVPRDLPVTLPSELVHQRPDILAAEAQLHSTSAQIGVATAAMFPQITLSGSYGSSSTSTGDLFSGPAAVWSIGAGLAAPIFHGGALWFQRRAAIDNYEQSLATYRQTVLGGLAQVADSLRALEHDASQVEAQSRQETAAREAWRLTDVNYRTGVADYLQVLVANVQYNQASIARIGGQAQRLQDTVALLVALGGGWREAREQ
ncbi:MAG TPA: efflux transporter outer membrane subunit [Candidatus Binatia bacterium]|nr:efflux transporter outer membrane subunit [Candidatus Binatia bacterium]